MYWRGESCNDGERERERARNMYIERENNGEA